MEIKNLEGVSHHEILEVFNESFSDYFIPLNLSEEQLISKMQADNTDLSLSVGAFENGKLIAFILHGIATVDCKKLVYNGGTGVIPGKRGFGLTTQMYRFILPLLAEQRIHKLILEVISQNIQAIKSYERSGFKRKRTLLCYKGEVKGLSTYADASILELHDYNWNLMESFWDITPTWQNSKRVIDELKFSNISLGAYIENQLVGYVIFTPGNKRIQQIAVHKDFRKRKIATSLIAKLTEIHGNALSIINVDEKSKVSIDFFEAIGLENSFEQIEMECELN